MFLYICDGLALAIIFICLLGISLSFEYFWPKVRYSLLFCAIPLSFLVPFFIEHFIGLGRPIWLFIPVALVSFYLIRRRGWSLAKESVLWYFLIGFIYPFWFRFQGPDMICFIEKVADHAFLIDCSRGGQLPPEDVWLKGAHVDMYYYFQYYVAAWLGRAMPLSTGASCNIGFALIIGFGCAAIGVVVREMSSSFVAGFLGVSQVLFGANGSSLLIVFMSSHHNYFDPANFYNIFDSPDLLNPDRGGTIFGRWFYNNLGSSMTYMPMEHISQTIVLGDFHPTLSGIYLLGMALLVIFLADREGHGSPTDNACLLCGCALPALAIVSNTWILPLNGLLLVFWLGYRWWSGKGDSLRTLVCYGGSSLLLIFPFLNRFVSGEENYHLSLNFNYIDISLLCWLVLFYPVAVMLFLGAWPSLNLFSRVAVIVTSILFGIYQISGLSLYSVPDLFPLGVLFFIFIFRGISSENRFFVFCAIMLLLFTRFVHVDDYLGPEQNSARKWWYWAFTFGIVIGLGAAWKGMVTRILAIGIIMVTTLPFLYIIGPAPYTSLTRSAGNLDGSTFLRQDTAYNSIIDYLNGLPKGILLEGAPANYPQDCPLFQQFTPHYSYGGWVDHELVWRGNRFDIGHLANDKLMFFEGKVADPKGWLLGEGIDYVLWRYQDDDRDGGNGPKIWALLNQKLSPDYAWRDFSNPDTPPANVRPVGVWVRRTN